MRTPTKSHFKLVSQIPSIVDTEKGELLFTVLDAWNGYYSIALEDEAKKYFGFQTEWGVYTYNVAPQGFLGSGDYYTKKMDEVMEKMQAKFPKEFKDRQQNNTSWVRCIDDTVLWSETLEESIRQTWIFIQECSAEGVVFLKKKFQFDCPDVEALGFNITQDGIEPTKE